MKYTQAQLLSITGMTVDRLRHWRKTIPSLDTGAGRAGALSFEEVVLVAALSRAVDTIGISLEAFAPHYDAMVAALQNCPEDRRRRLALWLDGRTVIVRDPSDPPPGETLILVRLDAATRRVLDDMQGTGTEQLTMALDGGRGQLTKAGNNGL